MFKNCADVCAHEGICAQAVDGGETDNQEEGEVRSSAATEVMEEDDDMEDDDDDDDDDGGASDGAGKRQRGGKVDADGRKRGGGGWSWVKKDLDALARLVEESGSTFDWKAIGGQMDPVRGAWSCQSMAGKEGMTGPKVDADGRKRVGVGWSWLKKDLDALARLVSESGSPFDWEAIGGQMNPVRRARSCRDMAGKEGMTGRKVDADGRKKIGNGWSWVQKDLDALARFVSESGSPFDWAAIGGQMDPVRGADVCYKMARWEGMTGRKRKTVI
jgi:hypothetical protein